MSDVATPKKVVMRHDPYSLQCPHVYLVQQFSVCDVPQPILSNEYKYEHLKMFPEYYTPLFLGQLPKALEQDDAILALIHLLLGTELANRGLIRFDRHRSKSCGTLWVKAGYAQEIKDCIHLRGRIEGESIEIYDSSRQVDGARRVTCEVKNNVTLRDCFCLLMDVEPYNYWCSQ